MANVKGVLPMGVFDFLKPTPKKELTELPIPPPPPTKGLDIDLAPPLEPPPLPQTITLIPPPPTIPAPKQPTPTTTSNPLPSLIPPVSQDQEVGILIPEPYDEASQPEQTPIHIPELPELEEGMVLEPTILISRTAATESIKPMFISVEDYQEILNSITVIKDALRDTEESMNRLNELKNTQEKILEDWRGHLEDAERKITYVDQAIFRGE